MKQSIRNILYFLFPVLLIIMTAAPLVMPRNTSEYVLELGISAEYADHFQIFYSDGSPFGEERSVIFPINPGEQTILTDIPIQTSLLRLDFGDGRNRHMYLSNVRVSFLGQSLLLANDQIEPIIINVSSDIEAVDISQDVMITVLGNDPYIVIDFSAISGALIPLLRLNEQNRLHVMLISALMLVALVILVFWKRKHFIKGIVRDLPLIAKLSLNDFRNRFAGSFLGIFWAFVQPVVTIVIYWFVFQVGFRVAPLYEYPYIVWFLPGIVAWFFFSEILNSSSGCFFEYSYLLRKVAFNIDVLPAIKAVVACITHLFFLCAILLINTIYRVPWTPLYLQVIYYFVCTVFLSLSLSYLFSSVIIFIKDLGQILNISLQFLMWLTPILWTLSMLPERLQRIAQLNPVYYIVEGYRNTFVYGIPFWHNPQNAIYFWVLSLLIFLFSTKLYNRLKPHFSDIL